MRDDDARRAFGQSARRTPDPLTPQGLRISQRRLAVAVSLTFQQVQKYERAANRISASKLYDIAAVLEAPVESFYAGLEPSRTLGSSAVTAAALTLATFPEAADLAAPMARLNSRRRRLVVAVATAIAEGSPVTE